MGGVARPSGVSHQKAFIAPAPPQLIAVGGLSGTGKSLLARALAAEIAPAPGAVVLRSDIERKLLMGSDEHAKLPPDAYTPAINLRVYAGIIDKARRAVAAGHSAIVDAVFAAPPERVAVEQSAAVLGVPFRGLFLTADLATQRRRDQEAVTQRASQLQRRQQELKELQDQVAAALARQAEVEQGLLSVQKQVAETQQRNLELLDKVAAAEQKK